jgi:predicted translin family RNA/ssDNA-binding protein
VRGSERICRCELNIYGENVSIRFQRGSSEEGALSKGKAIEAIETVAELMREIAEAGPADVTNHAAAQLVEAIAGRFAMKGYP